MHSTTNTSAQWSSTRQRIGSTSPLQAATLTWAFPSARVGRYFAPMTKRLSVIALLGVLSVRPGMAQNPPAPTSQSPQIDCSWLAVDSAAKTATLQLTAGLTGLNGGLNFNGFKDGALTLTVPLNWNVVVAFTNHDGNLPHSAEVVDSQKPMPAGPLDPAFARAMTVRLTQGV